MFILDFFGSQAGVELLRIVDSALTILAAILSGAAFRNTSQVKRAVGGVFEKPFLDAVKSLFRRARHVEPVKPDLKKDAFQSLTLAEKVDMLKDNQEREWIKRGLTDQQTAQRLDRVDPPTRRH